MAEQLTVDDLISRQRPGWAVPYLAGLDTVVMDIPANVACPGKPKGQPCHFEGHGRWTWWLDACDRGQVPETPIPPIDFCGTPDPIDAKAIQDVLKPYMWKGLGHYDDAWLALVKWLLYGFGYRPDELQREVQRIPAEIRAGWYQHFNLANLLHSPIDWSAYILQGGLPDQKSLPSKWASTTGFFSTPIDVVKMVVALTFGEPTHAQKFESVHDPCMGTGSMLLVASNHSLRLHGNDIVQDLVYCAVLNGYLWMPWTVLMPDWMREALDAGPTDTAAPLGLDLTTDPEVVAAITTQRTAVREATSQGELVQMGMFAL